MPSSQSLRIRISCGCSDSTNRCVDEMQAAGSGGRAPPTDSRGSDVAHPEGSSWMEGGCCRSGTGTSRLGRLRAACFEQILLVLRAKIDYQFKCTWVRRSGKIETF